MKTFQIFFDADGVTADYDQGFRNDYPDFVLDPALNRSSHLLPGSGSERKRAAYELIKGTDFYARLPIMPGAVDLYIEALKYDPEPIILTAAPKFGATEEDFHINPYWLGAAFHKRNWIEEIFLDSVHHHLAYMDDEPPISPPLHEDGGEQDWHNVWIRGSRKGRFPISDERFICTTSSRKHQYMHRKHSDHQILIDDRIDNITAWREAGGIGILHASAEQSIVELREICLTNS
jgi:hypothetical protein